MHVNFQLVNSPVIGLYSPSGEQMDLVELGEEIPDTSYGSRVDGAETILQTVVPTPRASNNRIKIASLTGPVGGKAMLAFSGMPDVTHRVRSMEDLSGSNWTDLGGVTARADG